MFKEDQTYTRAAIHAALGGSVQYYLPAVGGRVVAACLNPAYDPDAPTIVLPGIGPIIERTADQFTRQGNAVPTFLKRAVNHWKYMGDFRVIHQCRDQQEIERYANRANRIGDVTSILFLTQD